jgi:hypothetical protein
MNASPRTHPNAYASGLVGTLSAFLLYEAKKRLGVELDGIEQSYLSVAVAALVLALGRKKGGS